MKNSKILLIVMLAVGIIAGGAINNIAYAGRQDFTLVNYSGRTIYYLYVSRSDHTGWEEDLLGNGVLKHGDSRKINFSSNENGRYWDIRVVFEDGSDWYWNGVDLQTVYKMVIDGRGTAHYN